MTKTEQQQILLAGAQELGLALDESQLAACLAYVDELLKWNRRINLTAITDPADVLRQHLLDSLAVAFAVEDQALLDVGSGGGLPGLPLAILRPQMSITSIDSRNKKVSFQRHVARELGLHNFSAVCERVEKWQAPRQYPQIISRAFSSLALFAELAGPHLAEGGRLLAMKGKRPDAELAEVPASWQLVKIHSLRVPGLNAERHLVVLQRSHT